MISDHPAECMRQRLPCCRFFFSVCEGSRFIDGRGFVAAVIPGCPASKPELQHDVSPLAAAFFLKVFWQFLPLGVVAYGGPTAHIALLHERFVDKSKWLSEEQFVELMAVGQGLPGPTSTQVHRTCRCRSCCCCSYCCC